MLERTQLPPHLSLLPEEAVSAVWRLEFLARQKMQGTLTGRHSSKNKGASVEFAEHRAYVKGDNPRDLDWRVYARNDRHVIKQYIEETNLRTTVLLDASGSMGYGGDGSCEINGAGVTKFEYARYMAAVLTHFLIKQRDATGLVTFDSKVRTFLRPAVSGAHMNTMLEQLHETEPVEETTLAPVLHEVAERIPQRGVVILFSDLFDEEGELASALHHFKHCGHELVVFHIMAEEELSFPFKNGSHFTDLENPGWELPVDPAALRGEYLEQVGAFLEKIEKTCIGLGADYQQLSTKEPFAPALANYLANRRRR